ncbi:MAG: 30S ribosomal protein S13 [Candidatus Acididesulfobacter diazotrophicus]|jgi:small subunit ribosomal protein S13|uniref:Small ribosomal subunit protein uS13 n=1 Tax=Candidatus Acididesulfobacter diazotrophicus TaxID=2597226 RepID=A0A519BQ20_9DELT|nr:MAG: 30S ribosomal protein S13 [Candidatus Acididesulfobacter diazotrophicus]
MARISGIDLPKNKRIEIGLTYIFGIGKSTAKKILSSTGIDLNIKVNDLSEPQVNLIRQAIDKEFKVEGDLKREIQTNIKRLIDIASYRGLRHKKGLPVRGQRTKTNSRTRKGPRKSIGSLKKA